MMDDQRLSAIRAQAREAELAGLRIDMDELRGRIQLYRDQLESAGGYKQQAESRANALEAALRQLRAIVQRDQSDAECVTQVENWLDALLTADPVSPQE
jgi:hypothetical protein